MPFSSIEQAQEMIDHLNEVLGHISSLLQDARHNEERLAMLAKLVRDYLENPTDDTFVILRQASVAVTKGLDPVELMRKG